MHAALNVTPGDWLAKPTIDLSSTKIMGIINVTPDSFSGDGLYYNRFKIRETAMQMASQGAQIIDVGGESTRPGAEPVPLDEELDRVIPAIESIRAEVDVPISIDTMKPAVMQAAVDAGANMINDVNALQAPGALEVALACGVPVCLVHKRGEPKTMQQDVQQYNDVTADVYHWLQERIRVCVDAGLDPEKLFIDPGFGFGKTPQDNLNLTRALAQFKTLGCPIVFGASRKTTLGLLLNRPVEERLVGGVTLAIVALLHGASVIRTHDIQAMKDVLVILQAIHGPEEPLDV